MILEFWMALGSGILLAGALVAELLSLWRQRAVWQVLAPVTEIAAGIVLAIALALSIARHGAWQPDSLQHICWGLALAALVVHLAFTWLLRVRAATLAVDPLALALALVGAFAPLPASAPVDCTQTGAITTLTWGLLLLGIGASALAGGSAVMLAVRSVLDRFDPALQLPERQSLKLSLAQATTLALVGLGAGLTLAVWWAWRATGSLLASDARQGWLAIVWLLIAMSSLAWRLEKQASDWAAGLVLLASVTGLVSLLWLPWVG